MFFSECNFFSCGGTKTQLTAGFLVNGERQPTRFARLGGRRRPTVRCVRRRSEPLLTAPQAWPRHPFPSPSRPVPIPVSIPPPSRPVLIPSRPVPIPSPSHLRPVPSSSRPRSYSLRTAYFEMPHQTSVTSRKSTSSVLKASMF